MSKKSKDDLAFEKEMNAWIKEQVLTIKEDEKGIEYLNFIIKNLKGQISAKKEMVKHRRKRMIDYIKLRLSEGYNVDKKYRGFK